MFPIRDHNPSGRRPYVTYGLILLNFGVFLAYWYGIQGDRALARFFYTWGMVPKNLMQGHSYWGGLTHMFLHGGWMHLLGNMLFLWIFGDNLEDEIGHGRFALFYILSGAAAAALQMASDPFSNVPTIGASGAIAGVMGGYLLLFPKARIDVLFFIVIFVRVVPIPAWIVLGVWFGIQIYSGVSMPSGGGGVAYWAHAGGFAGGVLFALPTLFARGGPAFWRETQGHPPHPEAAYRLVKTTIPKVLRRL